MTNLEQLIKDYCIYYHDLSHSFIASLMLQEHPYIKVTHKTLRQKVSNCRKNLTESKYLYFDDEVSIEFNEEVKVDVLQPYLDGNPDNVLTIFDPHEPFCKDGYMEHTLEVQKRFDCGTIVFAGDIIDSHYSSFHPTDPDGFGAGEELDRAIAKIKEWHRLFPNAKVCLGNHDLIVLRKAFSSGVSRRWIKEFGEVLETPTWDYGMEFEIDDVLYTHTLGSNIIGAAVNRRQSVVTGHLHTKAEIIWNVSKHDRIFAMSGGCGIDDSSYAFAYAKLNAKKSILTTGVVLDKGKLPILIPMDL